MNCFIDLDIRVFELELRQGFLEVGPVCLLRIARLGDRSDERRDRALLILKVGRSNEIVLGSIQLVRKMMKHQDPATKPIGSDIKSRPEERKWVLPYRPGAYFRVCRRSVVVFAVI